MLTVARATAAATAPGSKEDRKKERQDAAARREELAPLRKSIKDAEDAIELLKKKRLAVERQLGDPTIYNGDPEKMIALGKDKAKLEAEIAEAEESWLTLSAELEGAEAISLTPPPLTAGSVRHRLLRQDKPRGMGHDKILDDGGFRCRCGIHGAGGGAGADRRTAGDGGRVRAQQLDLRAPARDRPSLRRRIRPAGAR